MLAIAVQPAPLTSRLPHKPKACPTDVQPAPQTSIQPAPQTSSLPHRHSDCHTDIQTATQTSRLPHRRPDCPTDLQTAPQTAPQMSRLSHRPDCPIDLQPAPQTRLRTDEAIPLHHNLSTPAAGHSHMGHSFFFWMSTFVSKDISNSQQMGP